MSLTRMIHRRKRKIFANKKTLIVDRESYEQLDQKNFYNTSPFSSATSAHFAVMRYSFSEQPRFI